VTLLSNQTASIELAYEQFKSDIYESLLLQTRLGSYFDKLDITISNDQVVLNTQGIEAAFKTAIASNPQAGIIDLAEFISAAGPDNLKNLPDQRFLLAA
jgi:hypothetical protein